MGGGGVRSVRVHGPESSFLLDVYLYQLHWKLPREKKICKLVKNTIFKKKTFTDCSLLLRQRMPHPQISQRKLSQIATKLQNSRKFFSLKSFLLYGTINFIQPLVDKNICTIPHSCFFYPHAQIISGFFLTKKNTNCYVEAEMYGLPADTVRHKYYTRKVQAPHPFWDDETFMFKRVS